MIRKKRFDARGKVCWDHQYLKSSCRDAKNIDLLDRCMLFQLEIFPEIEIEILFSAPGTIRVRSSYVVPDRDEYHELNSSQLAKLRTFYRTCVNKGWERICQPGRVVFKRRAVILRDRLRRYS